MSDAVVADGTVFHPVARRKRVCHRWFHIPNVPVLIRKHHVQGRCCKSAFFKDVRAFMSAPVVLEIFRAAMNQVKAARTQDVELAKCRVLLTFIRRAWHPGSWTMPAWVVWSEIFDKIDLLFASTLVLLPPSCADGVIERVLLEGALHLQFARWSEKVSGFFMIRIFCLV
jgi:hypothetical protein